MSTRRQGREAAMQFLFQQDFAAEKSLDLALLHFWNSLDTPPASEARTFGEALIRGCLEKQSEVDAHIKKFSENWDLPRLAAVDRAILRIAIYEMLFCEDIPPVVSINEAVEIAKKFSTVDSSKFVNGILDRMRKELTRPARQAK
jgi:N utilization substance protein B